MSNLVCMCRSTSPLFKLPFYLIYNIAALTTIFRQFLALLNHIVIHRGYAIPKFVSSICVVIFGVVVINFVFKRYLLWSLWTDCLQILCEASRCGSLPTLWKLWFLACYYRRTRQNRPNVQMLSPLKFMDWLASNFTWGILVWVSTTVMETMIFGLLL